ncbi:hypothetical protein UA32_11545 [Photobacterium angustum]|uniref:AraC family transcriptional regulator n=1 Tax=Photobacterium angustum TaxID=661 RepID=A0ABX5H0G9_PHOAN|nr:helix-turn-helix transcriptional regulator [Photobacterium angustum]KJG38013.1 hypothetical protein UA32_11545 [Photobacterium angustum]PSX06360.1 AraC family transcriptional regulator [Photobacterium angustum]
MLIVEKKKKVALNFLSDNNFVFFAKNNHIISFLGCDKIILKSSSGTSEYSENELILLERGKFYECLLSSYENINTEIYSIVDKCWKNYYRIYFHYLKSKIEVLSRNLDSKKYIVNALLVNFYHTVNDKEISNYKDSDVIRNITELILTDLKNKWSYDLICEKLYLSPATLYRELRKKNTSLKELTNNLRLTEAATLLCGTKLPVGIIANEVGFGSSSYFCKIFKQTFNCSPAEYRKMIN